MRKALTVFGLLLLGCATSDVRTDGLLAREPGFDNIADAGMAVLPVAHADPVRDGEAVTSFLTEELYVGLTASLPGAPLISPALTMENVGLAGDDALAQLRDLRGGLQRGEPVSKELTVAFSRVVLHRYCFVPWVLEERTTGMEEMSADYIESGYANDVRRAAFLAIKGRIEGVVVDLWEGEILWRGAVDYDTPRVYGAEGTGADEIDRVRADAADRLSLLFESP